MHGGRWQHCPLDRACFAIACQYGVSAGATGEEKQGGLGAAVPEPPSGPFPRLHEGRGRRETPARQSCMCRIKAALRREEALQAFTERAALAHGSLMGHKFLGRIVAC